MTERMTVLKAMDAVRISEDGLYGVLLENGSMELGYYKPLVTDEQTPHDQDEIYIVQTGSGSFICDDKHIEFEPGDSLFVAAGVEHRFVDFSPDFAAWVIFYGPEGGES
jgi:mannose-6-phosphate isomerase-like protein (cupin superfamily)